MTQHEQSPSAGLVADERAAFEAWASDFHAARRANRPIMPFEAWQARAALAAAPEAPAQQPDVMRMPLCESARVVLQARRYEFFAEDDCPACKAMVSQYTDAPGPLPVGQLPAQPVQQQELVHFPVPPYVIAALEFGLKLARNANVTYCTHGTVMACCEHVAAAKQAIAWAKAAPQPAPDVRRIDVDWLSNVIRSANGNNQLGAGALAEKIVATIAAQGGK